MDKINELSNRICGLETNKNVLELFKEALKCTICHATVNRPPLQFSKCCRQLVGCRNCVEQLGNRCPLCRNERFETIVVSTFDRLLEAISNGEN